MTAADSGDVKPSSMSTGFPDQLTQRMQENGLSTGFPRPESAPLRVMTMHAKYRVLGGEDVSHRTETAFLESSGYIVQDHTVANSDFAAQGPFKTLADMTFNLSVYKEVQRLAASFKPDIVYVNNTFPALSPSAIRAAQSMGVPVVQVLRNYRAGCIAGTVFRDGHDCQLCVGRAIPISGVRHACYRDSRAASCATTLAKVIQKTVGVLNTADAYIAVSDFVREIAVASGIESDRVVVRPNLVWPDPLNTVESSTGPRSSFLFVGRDSYDKGLHVLLEAVRLVRNSNLLMDVYGCSKPAGFSDERVTFHGPVAPSEIGPAMSTAMGVIVPSIWPEPFGRVVIEALSCGSPVVASKVGGMADFVGPGVTLVQPGNPHDLAKAMLGLLDKSPDEHQELSNAARQYYERDFAPQRWLTATQGIFDRVLLSR